MQHVKAVGYGRAAGEILAIGLALVFVACSTTPRTAQAPPAPTETIKQEATPEARAEVAQVAAAAPPTSPEGQPGVGQDLFASDDAAVKALLAATKADDQDAIHKIFGPGGKELVSGDRVEDRNDRQAFVKSADEHMRLEKADDHTVILHVGKEDWPFPIPIVKTEQGKWFFDTEAGKQELLARRIGDNELETIDVCHAYVQAQRDYASRPHDGSRVLQYAQHLASDSGKENGLYWKAKAGEPESPLNDLVAEAQAEGYTSAGKTGAHQPYHGYYYRILRRQGPEAPGGPYDYVINGNMIAGFALLAYPDKYGASGIMTFMVSHHGVVYQKDLGAQTAELAGQIHEYNPDNTWTPVK